VTVKKSGLMPWMTSGHGNPGHSYPVIRMINAISRLHNS